ncbi:MAG: hypothetical protein M9894_16905 [Planctomycetes bacterium]|nr:hypothetical protein [Planctomycetota bacterium]
MRREIATTLVTELVVLLAGLLVYRLALERLGTDGFAAYSLCRRTTSFLAPLAFVGLSVALPRAIAAAVAKGEGAAGPYASGLVVLALVQSSFWALSALFPRRLSLLLFGDAALEPLIVPLTCVVTSLVAHGACYAYLRGHLSMGAASALHLTNSAVVPLVAMGVGRDLREVLLTTGGLSLGVSSLFFAARIAPRLRLRLDRGHLRGLLTYGLQRLPGDFGLAALLGLPALMTTHAAGVQEGGRVAFSISLLSMAAAALAPIGVVMLPAASRAIALGDRATVRRYLDRLVAGSVGLAAAGTLVFHVVAGPLLAAFLGAGLDPDLAACSRRVFLCAVPYCLYVATRSIIDAWFVLSLNTITIGLALATFLALTSAAGGLDVVQALWGSIGLLGALTLGVCAYIRRACSAPSP